MKFFCIFAAMNAYRQKQFFFVSPIAFVMLLLLAACANIVSPTGGQRDSTPPRMLSAKPPDGSTRFNAPKIIIRFDEYIQIRDIYSQLMISPPLKEFPDVNAKDKSLQIKFKESLQDNTTYNLFFGESIVDITESNKLKGFRYVFSTGHFLDSLQLKGNVLMAKSASAEKDVLIMLYPGDANDSTPMLKRPLYVTRSLENGSFEFKNLASGPYKLFALKDANSNYLFDLPNEIIGFSSESVHPFYAPEPDTSRKDSVKPPPLPNLEVLLFQQEDSVQKVLRAGMNEVNRYMMAFRYPLTKPEIKPFEGNALPEFLTEINNTRDTLILWFLTKPADSIKALVFDDHTLIDTILSTTDYRTRRGVHGFADMKSLPVSSNIMMKTHNYFEPLRFELPRPLEEYRLSGFILCTIRDSIADTLQLKPSDIEKTGLRTLSLNYPFKQGASYELQILPGGIKDIYGLSNDTVNLPFTINTPASYGSLKLSIKQALNPPPYIIEIMKGENAVFNTFTIWGDSLIEISNIPPGKYSIRAIADANKNGRWDSGDYLKKIQAEKTHILLKEIQINPNWEMEVEIKPEQFH